MENKNTKQFEITDDLCPTAGQRFVNYIIDVIVIYIIIFLLGFIAAIVSSLLGSTAILDWLSESNPLKDYLIFFSIMIPYYTIFEKFTGRTVGKFLTKTMVINEDGSKIDIGTAFRRTFVG